MDRHVRATFLERLNSGARWLILECFFIIKLTSNLVFEKKVFRILGLSQVQDWLNDDTIFSVYRDDTIKLFNKLQQTKEVQYVTSGTLATGLGAARLPDLESAAPSPETCLEHIRKGSADFWYLQN